MDYMKQIIIDMGTNIYKKLNELRYDREAYQRTAVATNQTIEDVQKEETYKLSDFPNLENATYNCPCEIQLFSKSIPQCA